MARQHWKGGNMLYPVPAVMVSCQRGEEKANIITVAWAGTVCTNPPMLSISVRPERYSYDIIKETKEFVVNLTTKELTYATDYCGVRSGKNVDKYKEMNLTPSESKHIKAPGIMESPVNIECRVVAIEELGSHHLFLAKVEGVSVDESYLDETGKFNLNDLGLVAYSHGEYFLLGEKLGNFGYSVRKKDKSEKKQIKSVTKKEKVIDSNNTKSKKKKSSDTKPKRVRDDHRNIKSKNPKNQKKKQKRK